MSSFAIPDFSADFGRDSGNFNFQPAKARPADARDGSERAGRAERNTDARDASIRDSGDDRRERDDFDRALRDASGAREPQKAVNRDPARERAPASDVNSKESADPVSGPEDDAADQPDQAASAPKSAARDAAGKPRAQQSEQIDSAQAIALELSTQVVIAKKPAPALAVLAPQASEASDVPEDQISSSDAKLTGDPPAAKNDACATPAQTTVNVAPNTQVQTSTDAAAAAAVAGLLSAMNAPAQTPNQKHASGAPADTDASAPNAKSAPAIEPALLGAANPAAKAPAISGETPNAAAPAEAEAFNAALGKQDASAQKPAAATAPAGGVNHSNALNAAPAPNAAQQAALQNVIKASAAAAGKEAPAAAPKTADVKAADAKIDGAQVQQFTIATGAAADRRPTAANTTHAPANTETVAKSVVHFFRQSNGGGARFEIRLDPVELGRVDARVEVNSDKTVSLTLSADRPETLAELMRTARDLEKQLTDSGMKLSDDGVKFRLNADAQNGQGRQNAQLDTEPRRARGIYGDAEPAIDVSANVTLRRYRAGGVDVLA